MKKMVNEVMNAAKAAGYTVKEIQGYKTSVVMRRNEECLVLDIAPYDTAMSVIEKLHNTAMDIYYSLVDMYSVA